MSARVISFFQYVPREMGQCPFCKGFRVRLIMNDLLELQDELLNEIEKAPVEGLFEDPPSWSCQDCRLRF